MKDCSALKTRYQRDEPSVQLGGLASNLSRIAWYAERGSQESPIPLFRESKYFTEWAAASCSSVDQQGVLAELQLQLALWERGWGERLSPSTIAQEAQQWSIKLLEIAGLVHHG